MTNVNETYYETEFYLRAAWNGKAATWKPIGFRYRMLGELEWMEKGECKPQPTVAVISATKQGTEDALKNVKIDS